MPEPTIICPKCKNEIKLTESLAAPLIESTRLDFEKQLAQKDLAEHGTPISACRKQRLPANHPWRIAHTPPAAIAAPPHHPPSK